MDTEQTYTFQVPGKLIPGHRVASILAYVPIFVAVLGGIKERVVHHAVALLRDVVRDRVGFGGCAQAFEDGASTNHSPSRE